MITTLAPLILSGRTSAVAQNITTVAAPIWDIGANLKSQGITFAVFCLLGGTAVVSAITFFVAKDKTLALKVLGTGVVLAGLVSQLPSLGVVSKDTVGGLTHSGGYR